MPVGELNITDINLATYLRLHGFEQDRMELDDDNNCVWVFIESPELSDHVVAYATGSASVSPQEYSREFGRVRKNMFNFIDSAS